MGDSFSGDYRGGLNAAAWGFQPRQRVPILHALHANILDAFNEYGVQITSPNYESDPDELKVVPKSQWYAAPAAPAAGPPSQAGRGTAA